MTQQEFIGKNELQEDHIDIGEIVGQAFEEDELLSHTQALRLEVIKVARKNMREVPAYASLALAAAEGIDKQIMTKRKLGVLSAMTEQDESARSILRNIVAQTDRDVFKRSNSVNINETIDDSDKLPPPSTVEGVREIGVSTLTYERFMQEKGIVDNDPDDEE